MTEVNSKLIGGYEFDGETLTLLVEGKPYAYSGDTIGEVFAAFLAADSKGKFFLARIRNNKNITCKRLF